MPSKKSGRVSERKRARNTPVRSRAKTFVGKARLLLASKDIEGAETAARVAEVALDKAAQKGVLHKKNAARRKSRLMKQLHAAKSR